MHRRLCFYMYIERERERADAPFRRNQLKATMARRARHMDDRSCERPNLDRFRYSCARLLWREDRALHSSRAIPRERESAQAVGTRSSVADKYTRARLPCELGGPSSGICLFGRWAH